MAQTIDLTEASRAEKITALGFGKYVENRGKEIGKAAREALEDDIEPGETLNCMMGNRILGKVSKTRGSAGKGWKIKNEEEYGAWLHAHGYDDDVYPQPMPMPNATKQSYIKALIESNDGEVPDGIELDGGTNPTIKLTIDKNEYERVWQSAQLPDATKLLLEQGGEY